MSRPDRLSSADIASVVQAAGLQGDFYRHWLDEYLLILVLRSCPQKPLYHSANRLWRGVEGKLFGPCLARLFPSVIKRQTLTRLFFLPSVNSQEARRNSRVLYVALFVIIYLFGWFYRFRTDRWDGVVASYRKPFFCFPLIQSINKESSGLPFVFYNSLLHLSLLFCVHSVTLTNALSLWRLTGIPRRVVHSYEQEYPSIDQRICREACAFFCLPYLRLAI